MRQRLHLPQGHFIGGWIKPSFTCHSVKIICERRLTTVYPCRAVSGALADQALGFCPTSRQNGSAPFAIHHINRLDKSDIFSRSHKA
jgi:hypothetical protein